mmetsp:Transcript_29026/g.54430  ORF Transcript_29026/g.54430 Transcript_29026/m.54430 type:complete len:303 (-) Transcript_29026:96-1004(-)
MDELVIEHLFECRIQCGVLFFLVLAEALPKHPNDAGKEQEVHAADRHIHPSAEGVELLLRTWLGGDGHNLLTAQEAPASCTWNILHCRSTLSCGHFRGKLHARSGHLHDLVDHASRHHRTEYCPYLHSPVPVRCFAPETMDNTHQHLHLPQRLLQGGDDVVIVSLPNPQYFHDHLFSLFDKPLQRKAFTTCRRLHSLVEHGVDGRDILPFDHLRKSPSQRTVRAGKVNAVVQLVHLVQNYKEFVVQSGQRLGQHVQSLAGRPRFVRVKEEEDQVSAFGPPPHYLHEVVTSTFGFAHCPLVHW